MKQYRITSRDILPVEDNDCYLSPDDPLHDLMPAAMMGGLGSDEALAKYNRLLKPTVVGNNKGQIQREQGINPGTEAWFQLWFGNNK
jgi:hypothetical protein